MKVARIVFAIACVLFVAACAAPTVSDDQNYSFPKGHSVNSNHS